MNKLIREIKKKQKEQGNEESHERQDEKTKKTIGNKDHHKRNEDRK